MLANNDALSDIWGRIAPEVDAIAIRIKNDHRHIAAVDHVSVSQNPVVSPWQQKVGGTTRPEDAADGLHVVSAVDRYRGGLAHEQPVRNFEVGRNWRVDCVTSDSGDHSLSCQEGTDSVQSQGHQRVRVYSV